MSRDFVRESAQMKVLKYAKRIAGKLKTGDEKIDNMARAYWIDSMAFYYMTPLIAADIVNLDFIADTIGKAYKYLYGLKRDIKAKIYYRYLTKGNKDTAMKIFANGIKI